MAESEISGAEKRGRGRPRVNPTSIHLSMAPEQLKALDRWIARHPDPKPSRPEAIRQILAAHLTESGHIRSRRDLRPSKRTEVHQHKASDEASGFDTHPVVEESGDVIGEP